jgi:cyclin D1/2/4
MALMTGATVPPLAPKTATLSGAYYSSPRSPTGVLDAGCLSFNSDGSSTATTASSESSLESYGGFDSSPVSSKRRKMSR